MILSFHRSHRMAVNIAKPGFETRAFVFDVQAGVSKPEPQVDPLSGMLINLVSMDAVMGELQGFWASQAWGSLPQLLEKSLEFLGARFKTEKVFLQELCLTEKRGFWLKWRGGKLLSGHEEIRELDSVLYKILYEYQFAENLWEQQVLKLSSASDLLSEKVFLNNPGLDCIEIENLATSEKWSYVPRCIIV